MIEHALLEIGFRPLLDAAPDATVVVDRHGSVVALNRDIELLFGWPEAELLGQTMNRLIPARFHRVLEHMLEIPVSSGEPVPGEAVPEPLADAEGEAVALPCFRAVDVM